MSTGSFRRIPRRWRVAGAAVVALTAMFGVGAFTGSALTGGGDERPITRVALPANAESPRGGSFSGPVADKGSDGSIGASEDAPTPVGLRYAQWCPAPLPGGVAGSVIDPSAAGLAMKLLGPGFELQSIALRGEGECDDSGQPSNVVAVLDTSWVHPATGVMVWVSQRPSPEVANYRDQYSAMVWADGYLFQLSAGGGYFYPLEEPVAIDGDAATHDAAASKPVEFRVPSDEQVAAVLREAIAQVAPNVPDQCFYRIEAGGWEALAQLGIGDPRPAIPAGYAEDYVAARILVEPGASCGQPELEGYYSSGFDAGFSSGDGWISVSAYPLFAGGERLYYGGEGSIAWSDGRWQYNVNGYGSGGPLPAETLRAIAVALSPGVDIACLPVDRELSEDDVVSAGFHLPVVPDSYRLEKQSLVYNGPDAGCDDGGVGGSYRLAWAFLNEDGDGIDISAYHQEQSPSEPGMGWIGDGMVEWSNARGTWFHVGAWSANGGPALTQDELAAIARSIDPEFDPSNLEGGRAAPMPEGAAPAAPPR
ncbi:MAG: hypothetical protein Kow0010_16740 [Dehalococcoidia bacterium]